MARPASISPSSIVPSLLPVRTERVVGVRTRGISDMNKIRRTNRFFRMEIDRCDCSFMSGKLRRKQSLKDIFDFRKI